MLSRLQLDIIRRCAFETRQLLEAMQDEVELFASANTLAQVEAYLLVAAQTLAHLPSTLQLRLARIDWHSWQVLHDALEAGRGPRREEVWYGISVLLPAAFSLIEELSRREPVWFEFGY